MTSGSLFLGKGTVEDSPMVVFVTAYPEYAVESYKVNALDYLLKPYGSEDFNRVVEKVYNHWSLLQCQNSSSTIEDDVRYLKCDHRFIRVKCDDIRYIEGHSEYLKIHLVSDDPFLTHMTFSQINDSFPDNFIQIHRSYVVNMRHVVSVERTMVILYDGTRLPVSSSRRNFLMKYIAI